MNCGWMARSIRAESPPVADELRLSTEEQISGCRQQGRPAGAHRYRRALSHSAPYNRECAPMLPPSRPLQKTPPSALQNARWMALLRLALPMSCPSFRAALEP